MSDDAYRWVPPGLAEDEVETFLSIKKGIPDAARDSLTAWLVESKFDHESVSWKFVTDFQTASGKNLGVGHVVRISASQARDLFRKMDEKTFTYLLDFVVSSIYVPGSGYPDPARVAGLSTILQQAGSSWAVGKRQGRHGLVERVPRGVMQTVDLVLSTNDRASDLLRRAWEGVFGVSPSPSHAYYDAVRAVEVLANPLISPKDGDATLGKDIAVLRTQGHKWHFAMADPKHAPAVEHVRSAMQLLWHSQSDRHGVADYADVSLEEAKAAVLLASTLVGWLSMGALTTDA